MKNILIKGAGDLATGIGWRLKRAGFNVIMTEIEQPLTVRLTVSYSQAVYCGRVEIEGITGVLVHSMAEAKAAMAQGQIAVIVDPKAAIAADYKPDVIVDAIMAKCNTGTSRGDAPLVIAVGPGFYAGRDCDFVIETKRGHFLGRVIEEGEAIPNTGVPGNIGGYTTERIIRAVKDGVFHPAVQIGDSVKKGDIVAYVDDAPVRALLDGIVRGMLYGGIAVSKEMKCGDIDPRAQKEHCFTISDKSRAIGGGALEAVMYGLRRLKEKGEAI